MTELRSTLMLAGLLAGCMSGTGKPVPEAAAQPAEQHDAASPPVGSAVLSVEQLLSQPPGSRVTARGLFLAFEGPCAGPPPTRSAWHLASAPQGSGRACIYVTGSLPPGTRTMPAEGVGRPVEVSGVLREQQGVLFLQAEQEAP